MSQASAALAWLRGWGRVLLFAYTAAAAALSPAAYTRRMAATTLRQIYFTAWQVAPAFVLFASALSLVVIEVIASVAREYGLSQYALDLVFGAMVLEIVPLLTALFVALRSGSAITTEMAMIRVTGYDETMRAERIDPFEREFVPRIVAATISLFALTVLVSVAVMAIAYLVFYGFTPAGLADFTRTVGRVFDPAAMALFALKCAAFGLAIAVIPIAAGLEATRVAKSAPVAVMGGMVKLFFALAVIELAALAVRYL